MPERFPHFMSFPVEAVVEQGEPAEVLGRIRPVTGVEALRERSGLGSAVGMAARISDGVGPGPSGNEGVGGKRLKRQSVRAIRVEQAEILDGYVNLRISPSRREGAECVRICRRMDCFEHPPRVQACP